jgi:protoporphyrinogen oxidase
MSTSRVVVIGGGICGLAAAHRLVASGIAVTVLESSDQLGGLGTFFPIGEHWGERFYHCIMPSDDNLLRLLDDLGIKEDIDWRETRMGMIVDGVRFPFNSAMDLLRFTPLSMVQRVRFGAISVLLRRLGAGKDLDGIRTEDWLRSLYGHEVWSKLLAPMFGSKFGSSFGDVPALYLWQRLGRESNVATRGYPTGGYKRIIDRLRASIEDGGGIVCTSTPVRDVRCIGSEAVVTTSGGEQIAADQVVSTIPIPLLRQLADAELADVLPSTNYAYQGVVNVLFFLKRPLDGHYWSPVLRSGTEFDGLIEMTELTGTEIHGGRHLVYAMHYTSRESDLYQQDASEIAERWTQQLLALYADLPLAAADIDEVRVFRAPFVEPIYPLGFLRQRPAMEVPGTPLLLATTAQVYPHVTSWNSSVGLANDVAERALANSSPAISLID